MIEKQGRPSSARISSLSSSPQKTILPGKPKLGTQKLMTANRIRDAIDDYAILKRNKNKPKPTNHEALPPLSAAYRQMLDLRHLDQIGKQMEKELKKCDEDDIERQHLMNEVLEKCENLKKTFEESENMYVQLQREKKTHEEMMRANSEEEKAHYQAVKRYLKCGESLVELWEILKDTIVENQCYYDFMEEASGGRGIRSISRVFDRFENYLSIQNHLTQLMDESLKRGEVMKEQLFEKKKSWAVEESYEVMRLQSLYREMSESKFKNTRYETILRNVTVESVDHMKQLNRIIGSFKQMIEDLIERKVVGKSYRKKTLAQQIEAIREDYLKRKAIIHEYEKGKGTIDRKRSKRVALYNKFSRRTLISPTLESRLDDLCDKKRKNVFTMKYHKYMKTRKAKGLKSDSDIIEYEPLKDETNFVDLNCRLLSPSSDVTDDDKFEDDDDELSFTKFSSTGGTQTNLNTNADDSSFISSCSTEFSKDVLRQQPSFKTIASRSSSMYSVRSSASKGSGKLCPSFLVM